MEDTHLDLLLINREVNDKHYNLKSLGKVAFAVLLNVQFVIVFR